MGGEGGIVADAEIGREGHDDGRMEVENFEN